MLRIFFMLFFLSAFVQIPLVLSGTQWKSKLLPIGIHYVTLFKNNICPSLQSVGCVGDALAEDPEDNQCQRQQDAD